VLWSLKSVALSGRRTPRLQDVTLAIESGITAVLGQSGAGKTSLLNLLVHFERPTSGSVNFHEPSPAADIPFFWAPPQHGLWPHLTVREHLTTVSGDSNNAADDHAAALLAKFDLSDLAHAKPGTLSLGERSRLNVARALASGARILVMDEPLSHVDSGRLGKYWDVVREECAATGSSLVFATHSPETVLREAHRVICLTAGKVVYTGPVDCLYEHPSTPDLAALLGPCNWLTTGETTTWCDSSGSELSSVVAPQHVQPAAGVCYRPEQIDVQTAADSPLRVESSRFAGSSAELRLHDDRSGISRSFVYRPHGSKRIRPGDRVVLRLLLLFLLVCLPGCLNQILPSLSVQHEANWYMHQHSTRIPAPRGMTVSPDDEYLVLDNAGRVLVFDKNGDFERQWWMPEYSVGKAEGICVLKDGRIAVADTHYHRVVFFDHDGNVTSMIGQRGSRPGDFVYPVAVIQDPDENIYVCEYGQNDRVQKFRPDGTWLLQFGGTGTEPGQFQRPSGIVWYDHRLYVVDAFNHRIQVFTDEGRLVDVLGASDKSAPLHYPYDIAIDQNADLFVVEYGGGCVSKLSRDGRMLGRYGVTGRGQKPGEFSTPWSLAFDNRGRLYVCDTGNRRIVELQL